MEPEVLQPVVSKTHKRLKMAQVNHKQNILTKTYHFRGRLWGKSYNWNHCCWYPTNGWNMETLQKMATYVDAPQKKINKCTKKGTLGPTAGHGVTTLPCCSLWLLRCHKRSGTEASRRGKNWMSECLPDMIRMIENHIIDYHRFLIFFLTLEEQNRVTAQAKRKFSLLSHTPANRNESPCGKHFLTTPANTSILSLSLKNQNFKFVTLTRAPSQPVAVFTGKMVPVRTCNNMLHVHRWEMLRGPRLMEEQTPAYSMWKAIHFVQPFVRWQLPSWATARKKQNQVGFPKVRCVGF